MLKVFSVKMMFHFGRMMSDYQELLLGIGNSGSAEQGNIPYSFMFLGAMHYRRHSCWVKPCPGET